MIGRDAVIARGDVIAFHHVGEEGNELEGFGRQRVRNIGHNRIGGEEFGIVRLDHPAARAGRHHNVIEAFENIDDLACDRLGVVAIAGIKGRLPAAGLGGRNFDAATRLFQKLYRSEANGRAEEIDETRYEKRHARRVGHVSKHGQALRRKQS